MGFYGLFFCLSAAAFLSSLDQYEIAIPVRVGPNGATLDAETPQHHRRRRSTEDKLPDSVLCFSLRSSYIYTQLKVSL